MRFDSPRSLRVTRARGYVRQSDTSCITDAGMFISTSITGELARAKKLK